MFHKPDFEISEIREIREFLLTVMAKVSYQFIFASLSLLLKLKIKTEKLILTL